MPGDEYASVGGGGALKLKGGKVQKTKKKKKDKSKQLERALSTEASGNAPSSSKSRLEEEGDKDGDVAKIKRERDLDGTEDEKATREEDDAGNDDHKTEAERRFEEANKKKMLKMFDSSTARPELLKTHKERVEGLNTYLSKLSEHHDMPKIGPG